MNTSILYQKENYYNPYYFQGKVVNKIFIYSGGEIIGSFRWFGSNNHYPEIKLPFEIKNKRKKDLNFKTGFAITEQSEYEKEFNIYINAENFVHTKPETIIETSRDSKSYYKKFTINLEMKQKKVSLDSTGNAIYSIDTEFSVFTKEVKTWIKNEPTKHKIKLDNFIKSHNLDKVGSNNIMDVLTAAKCTNILDNY